MPTILSHAAVPLAIGLAIGPRRIPPALLGVGVAAAMLPDLDVIAFGFGIPYEHALGHRGASHSLAAALIFALVCAAAMRGPRIPPFALSAAFLLVVMASHGIADMFTNGGRGVALLWPASDARLFAPWRPIEVSAIGVSRFFSSDFIMVLMSEALWIWLPCALLAVAVRRLAAAPVHPA